LGNGKTIYQLLSLSNITLEGEHMLALRVLAADVDHSAIDYHHDRVIYGRFHESHMASGPTRSRHHTTIDVDSSRCPLFFVRKFADIRSALNVPRTLGITLAGKVRLFYLPNALVRLSSWSTSLLLFLGCFTHFLPPVLFLTITYSKKQWRATEI